jgi:hypothetical protein
MKKGDYVVVGPRIIKIEFIEGITERYMDETGQWWVRIMDRDFTSSAPICSIRDGRIIYD